MNAARTIDPKDAEFGDIVENSKGEFAIVLDYPRVIRITRADADNPVIHFLLEFLKGSQGKAQA